MNCPDKILVVDDEPHICEVIRLYLEHAGFESVLLNYGNEAVETVEQIKPSLVLLDIMLPDITGFDICSGIRSLNSPSAQTPIILLTAKSEPVDKLRGFHLGVDDYIVKPFEPNELIARIKAILRRSKSTGAGTSNAVSLEAKRILEIGSLHMDLEQYKVIVNGHRIELTPKEMELLYFLGSHRNRVFSREDLLGYVWNFDFTGETRTVDAHVKNIRKKLGIHKDWSIQTLWGVGYSFEVPNDAN